MTQLLNVCQISKLAEEFLFLQYPKPFVEILDEQRMKPPGEARDITGCRPSSEILEMLFDFLFGHYRFRAFNSIERASLVAVPRVARLRSRAIFPRQSSTLN